MKSEWKVCHNNLNGIKYYEVGRFLDDSKPFQSENFEYADGIFYDRNEAEKYAKKLNMDTPKVLDSFEVEENMEVKNEK